MTTFTGTIPTIASGDTTTVPTNLATYRDALKALTEAGTSYVPTYSNFTLGNGTAAAAWARQNKWADFRIRIALGTTSAVTGAMTISLPATPIAQPQLLTCFIGSNLGTVPLTGMGYVPASTASVQPFHPTSTTNGTQIQLGSAALTMGSGSYIMIQGRIELA